MKSKHTPGPWELMEDRIPGSLELGANGRAICEIWRRNDPETENANASLITAAPDLLEALEAVMAILPVCPKNTGIAGIEARYNFAVVGARAAIAKAIGHAAQRLS